MGKVIPERSRPAKPPGKVPHTVTVRIDGGNFFVAHAASKDEALGMREAFLAQGFECAIPGGGSRLWLPQTIWAVDIEVAQ